MQLGTDSDTKEVEVTLSLCKAINLCHLKLCTCVQMCENRSKQSVHIHLDLDDRQLAKGAD